MTEAEALIQLQEIDIKLLRHASSLAAMPQQKRMKTIELTKRKVATELKRLLGQRKDAETDIAELEANLHHYEEKTIEVQALIEERQESYRSIRDIEASLTSLAKRIEKANFDLVPMREGLERLQLAERNANLTMERLDAELAACQKSFDDDAAAIKQEILSLKRDREDVCSHISADMVKAYEAARVRFKGIAVETLTGNLPSVCRVKLQPAAFNDLRRGPEVTECPYCHRILITSDPFGTGEEE